MAKLKHTNSNEFKLIVWNYILDCINFEDTPNATDLEKVQKFRAEFNRVTNYPYNLKCFPLEHERMGDYLAGLPIGIAYAAYHILEINEDWHGVKLTEKQEDNITERWFVFIAFKFLQLEAYMLKSGKDMLDLAEQIEAKKKHQAGVAKRRKARQSK